MGKLTSLDVLDTVEVEPGRFVCTPHPILVEGQTNIACDLRPGEDLCAFLSRHIDLGEQWEVSIGGVVVPVEHWMRVKPKHGQVIEVRGAVNRQVLMIVAMIALTYFTMGAGAGWIAGTFGVAAGGAAAAMIGAGLFMAGSMLIQKVLGPKPPRLSADDRESVFALSGARNRLRQNEPLGFLFGSVKVAPDIASLPYTYFAGDDQYLAMVLTPGINVARFEPLQNGDTLLSSFEGVQTWTAGFSGMPDQAIPLYSNADTINGGELDDAGTWVERTTSLDTMRVMFNLEYVLGGRGTSGKDYYVSERIVVEYRPVGGSTWQPLISRDFRQNKIEAKRATITADLPRGQYDVRVRKVGLGNYSGKNTQENQFQWTTLTSVQADDTDYAGISRIGLQMKASGQLNGAPDEIRGVMHAEPMPIWTGAAWGTATDRASGLSNPGAQILMYARGIKDENGKLIAGIGLDDEMIDIEALQAFMLHCAANGYTYDYWLAGVRSHEEQVQSIALAGFGQITWAGGRLSVVWAADEQPLSGVVNMATIKKGQFQVDYTLANAADGIEYSYFDRADWQTKTLRVAAPGVTTMLNPAQVQGEGVTSEAHAAELARYHLAQSLYQFKDISYSTDLEHLSYRRLSVLALQHDLTQWGYGGRVQAAVDASGAVTLTLDEPVPAPSAGNAYIGLRIPGESVYRIFTVTPFAGESTTIQLTGEWPNDAVLPGDHPDNPAHDTIWIYDFKQTPGYRVRVVDVQPEAGLKGASVAVVPEGPEFWNYVKTGEYIPAPNSSLLQTRPVASNLRVSESQVVQGDTLYTELAVTFDVSGPVGHTVVQAALPDVELAEVAQTMTRTARWRIEDAGVYTIVVRPYAPDGTAGVAATIVYTTTGADVPPALFDYFDVQELSGGVRKYSFGFNESDDAPVNLAGAEIRYTAGNVPAPQWALMTPLGVDGFFTSAVEMVVPVAGEWTFACRSRNTSSTLSTLAKVLTKTLTANLGEVIGGIQDDIVQSDQAAADALAAALAASAAAAQEAIDRARDISGVAGAVEYDPDVATPAGTVVRTATGIYRATQAVPTGTPPPNATYWHPLGTVAGLADGQAGQSQAIFDLQATSEDLGYQQALMAGALVDVQTALPGKASTQSVSLLQGEVESIDGRTTANANAITQVNAAAGGSGANLLWKEYSYFDSATLPAISRYGEHDVDVLAHASVSGFGGYLLRMLTKTATVTASVFLGTNAVDFNISLVPGRYILSFDAWTPGFSAHNFRLNIDTNAGVVVGPLMIAQSSRTRFESVLEIPAGATAGIVQFEPNRSGSVGLNIYFDRLQLERALLAGTTASAWTPGSSARQAGKNAAVTQTMRAEVDTLNNRALASWTMVATAGGDVAGMQLLAGGGISAIRFLSETIGFYSSDGSFEIANGRTITRSGGYMNVSGKPFGVGGDLIEWFGLQQTNLNNCSRSNAIFFKTNTGIFYAKGMIFAGTITAGGQTLALNATSYTTGTFGTNGGPIQVNASFAHSKRQNAGQIGTTKNTIAKGAGTNGGSIELWRRIGGGGWEFVAGTSFGGTLNVVNYPDPDIAGYAQWSLGGSITYTDNVGGTAAREYEVRLASLTMQAVTITGSAPVPAATESRNIGVLTAEG